MPSLKSWLIAARLRTLPLSVSGILMGSALALNDDLFQWDIFVLALVATLGFQVLSNFANDYGDGVKGTDNEDRVGPARAMQSGLMTPKDLIRGMIVVTIATLAAVIVLIYVSFGIDQIGLSLVFLGLGIAAMIAAVKYTVGNSAYGYKGLGDVFVFLFFGIVGVLGCYFLYTQQLYVIHVLPAITIGLLATVVLHLNNMRDREADQKVGKRTLAVILGKNSAVLYHGFLLGTAMLSWCVYLLSSKQLMSVYSTLIFLIPMCVHWGVVLKTKNHPLLDPELKKVALITFGLALLFFLLNLR
ncbi:MAG: 1,4-dihydroxy-2-naphthoate octaprenyltransferase [Gammaproteobacteria bacterium]|jgi:1,4-dihydroxy-2-naphthoate octaprenyltransferase